MPVTLGLSPSFGFGDQLGLATAGPIGARVEIFSDGADEGRYYEGSATVNSQYQWTYFGRFRGPNLTAIAIDSQTNDSSVFSTPWGGAGGCYIHYLPITSW
jgi:hypothetical protein